MVCQRLQDFGPEESFLPYYVDKEYEIFNKRLLDSKTYKHIFFHFLVFFLIPWIVSWQYSIGVENRHPILAQQIYIRWLDKFKSPINLDLLAYEPSSPNLLQCNVPAVLTESLPKRVSLLEVRHYVNIMPTHDVCLLLSALFLQVLQVKEKEPPLNETKILQKAQQQLFPPSSPIMMSQHGIDEVLATLAPIPSPDIEVMLNQLICPLY